MSKIVTLDRATLGGVPNRNGNIYYDEDINKLLSTEYYTELKKTNRLHAIADCRDIADLVTIDPRDVVGTILEITEDKISINILNEEIFNRYKDPVISFILKCKVKDRVLYDIISIIFVITERYKTFIRPGMKNYAGDTILPFVDKVVTEPIIIPNVINKINGEELVLPFKPESNELYRGDTQKVLESIEESIKQELKSKIHLNNIQESNTTKGSETEFNQKESSYNNSCVTNLINILKEAFTDIDDEVVIATINKLTEEYSNK